MSPPYEYDNELQVAALAEVEPDRSTNQVSTRPSGAGEQRHEVDRCRGFEDSEELATYEERRDMVLQASDGSADAAEAACARLESDNNAVTEHTHTETAIASPTEASGPSDQTTTESPSPNTMMKSDIAHEHPEYNQPSVSCDEFPSIPHNQSVLDEIPSGADQHIATTPSHDSILEGIQPLPIVDDLVMPPELARHDASNSRNRRNQQPGAYAMNPSFLGQEREREQAQEHLDVSFNNLPEGDSNANHHGHRNDISDMPLIEATLVPAGQNSSTDLRAPRSIRDISAIPQAVIVETNNLCKSAHLRGRAACLALLVLVLALAVTAIACGTGNVCANGSDDEVPLVDRHDETIAVSSTMIPTSPPSLPPYSLPKYTLDSLEDPTTAQSKANEWLLLRYGEDALDAMPFWRRDQLFVLACLYYSFDGVTQPDILRSADESPFHQRHASHHDNNECQWSSVTCNEDGRVIAFQLTMSPIGVVGSIPPEIELLTSLQSFAATFLLLEGNLDDILPTQMQNLESLQVLSLEENEISGTLPRFLVESMTQLTSLSLKNNRLTGTIHPELLSTAMTPSMSNLEVLEINRNRLTGTIPVDEATFVGNTNLQILAINHNEFLRGTIPPQLSMLTALQTLYLDECSLTGTLPTELGLLADLNYFRGHQNLLEGPLPSEIGLLSKLLNLRFHTNQFSGAIPTELGLLQQLTSLSMRNNNFSGTLPTTLGLLENVGHLTFAQSMFSGTVPSELGLCTSLHKLGLGLGTSGTIPESLCRLTVRDEKPVKVTMDCQTMEECPADCECSCA